MLLQCNANVNKQNSEGFAIITEVKKWRNRTFGFFFGGVNNSVFSPPPSPSKESRILAAFVIQLYKFLRGNKSKFVEQKKIF